jgi:putative heme-binding domain-containing protein
VLSGGNPIQGRIVFFGAKVSCAACHAVNGQGGNISPELGKIGNIRTPRDLLESIVFPSSSIVRDFESYTVVTHAGRVHSGLIRHATTEAVTLLTTERTELRLPRDQIEEIQPSRVSIMPRGIDTQLSRQQLSDLIAYLASLK